MAWIVFATAFFGLTSVVLAVEIRLLRGLTKAEIASRFGRRWENPIHRRMRIATPAGLLLSLALFTFCVAALIDTYVRGSLLLVSFALGCVVVSGALSLSALILQRPRGLILPAFRSCD